VFRELTEAKLKKAIDRYLEEQAQQEALAAKKPEEKAKAKAKRQKREPIALATKPKPPPLPTKELPAGLAESLSAKASLKKNPPRKKVSGSASKLKD